MVPQRTFSDTPWEAAAGYCRALRLGPQIWVAGTAPRDDHGGTFAPGDAYAQTKRCFELIEQALMELGASLKDIVRTRIYVTDMGQWEAIAQAHYELFADHPPVNTMVEIAALINPDMVVEIEVDAYCEPSPTPGPTSLTRRTILGRPIQPTAYPSSSSYPPTTAPDLDAGCLD